MANVKIAVVKVKLDTKVIGKLRSHRSWNNRQPPGSSGIGQFGQCQGTISTAYADFLPLNAFR